MDIKFLVNQIDTLRNQKNITIKEMLSESGLTKNAFDNIKKGSMPSIDKICAIAEYFDVSVDYLTGLDLVPNRKKESPASDLTDLEQVLLEKFNHLLDIDKGRILDRIETIYESYSPEQKENVS